PNGGKWAAAAVLCLCAIVGIFYLQYRPYEHSADDAERTAELSALPASPPPMRAQMPAAMMLTEPLALEQGPSGLMIVQTLSLKFISSHVDDKQIKIDDIIRRVHGYIDRLTIRSDIGAVHSLSAILRIP